MLRIIAVDETLERPDRPVTDGDPCTCTCASGVTEEQREIMAVKLTDVQLRIDLDVGGGDDDD